MEEMFIAVWVQQQTESLSQAKGQPVVLTDDRNGIPKLENFIDTKHTPDQHNLVEDRIEENVLEKEESSSQNSKKQGATTSSLGSQKSEVETEHCKVQIWSKQNVSLALKMRGITVRWRRGRASKDSRIVSKKTSHRKGVQNCNDKMANSESMRVSTGLRPSLELSKLKQLVIEERSKDEPTPPEPRGVLPVTSALVRKTVRREESQRMGNKPPPPPKPPDWSVSVGGEGNANTNRGDCGKKKMSLVQLPSPSKLPATVAIDKGWLDLTSPLMQGKARNVQDEARRVQWELHIMGQIQRNVDNWDLGLTLNQVGQAQNVSGKWIARRVLLHCTYPLLSKGDLFEGASPGSLVDWIKGEPLNEFVKNALLELKAAQFLFDKMHVRDSTDKDMVGWGHTENNPCGVASELECVWKEQIIDAYDVWQWLPNVLTPMHLDDASITTLLAKIAMRCYLLTHVNGMKICTWGVILYLKHRIHIDFGNWVQAHSGLPRQLEQPKILQGGSDVNGLVMLSMNGITWIYDRWLGNTHVAAVDILSSEFVILLIVTQWASSADSPTLRYFCMPLLLLSGGFEDVTCNNSCRTSYWCVGKMAFSFTYMLGRPWDSTFQHQQISPPTTDPLLQISHGWHNGVWWAHLGKQLVNNNFLFGLILGSNLSTTIFFLELFVIAEKKFLLF